MLPKLFKTIDDKGDIFIRKFCGAEDVSDLGAFRYGDKVCIEVSIARRLGASAVVLRICRDGRSDRDITLSFADSDSVHDIYAYTLDTKDICDNSTSGLFYYEFLIIRGAETLFTDTYNNKDFDLSMRSGRRFSLLVYGEDFNTPARFGKGVMYQIFTDRFAKGECDEAKNIPVRDDVIINGDWEDGIPQYAKKVGDPLKNNMFFGGNLYGVIEKLDYLESLGVTYIYLCPVFKAYSNHKYDTGDYTEVDAMFGGDEALDLLIRKARDKGIGIILDGVFNHTGDDSKYFNKYGHYGKGGAYRDSHSEYKDWYCFRDYPREYESWWGIDILPKLNHENEECRRYFTGKDGIVQKYLKKGIAGWRLDVADELSDRFLDELRAAAKEVDSEAVIIGEVWENAVQKIAYGKRRRYFSGRQLDSVMNYPLKNSILDFCIWGDGEMLYNTITELYSTYPRIVSDKLMNIIGTHDTMRVLTVLGKKEGDEDAPNSTLAIRRLSPLQKEKGVRFLKIASTLQYTIFGIPSVYYGDEVGLEGYGDPFCRMPFPWHELDLPVRAEILDHYRRLGEIRKSEGVFDSGRFYVAEHSDSSIVFVREKNDERVIVAANRGKAFELDIPDGAVYEDLMSGERYVSSVTVEPDKALIFKAHYMD